MVRLFVIIGFLLMLYSCGRQKKAIYKENQSGLYQPSVQALRPECSIFHLSDSLSQLLIKLNLNELLFNQANPENKLMSRVRLKYSVVDITEDSRNKEIVDSLTVERSFDKVKGKDIIVISVNFKALSGRIYNMSLDINDILRRNSQKNFLIVDKQNGFTPQNYRVIAVSENLPVFGSYIPANDSFRIVLNRKADKLFVKYVKDDTPLPPPPFSRQTEPAFDFYSDSSWVLPYTVGKVFYFQKPGYYLIQTDSSQSQGLLLASYSKSFPLVKDARSMIQPLEYLSTSEEFRELTNSTNAKQALDKFWLKFAGNAAVGREMIRIYYNRMYLANLYFSSYKPGWKTDRGMIYMVFGPPSYIRKTFTNETWEYYIREDGQNLSLDFMRIATPYSYNHYILDRSDIFTPFWRAAIGSWRRGKVFSLED